MVCVDVGMCTVWKDGVLKLCESSGRCECNGVFRGGGSGTPSVSRMNTIKE